MDTLPYAALRALYGQRAKMGGSMETDMIDKLFLELSQVTKAKTKKELDLEGLLKCVLEAWEKDGIKDMDGHRQLYNRASHRITTSST